MPRSRKAGAARGGRKQVGKDFVKKKTKLGKRPRVAGNDTDTQIRARKIFLPSQSSLEASASTAHENPILWGVQVAGFIQKTKHHNARARADALNSIRGVVGVISDKAEAAPFWIGSVLECALDCLEDDAKLVRRATVLLLSKTVSLLNRRMSPFASLVAAKVTSALSSLHIPIRIDAAAAVLAILDATSDWKFNNALTRQHLLEPFADLLRVVKKQVERKTVLQAIHAMFDSTSGEASVGNDAFNAFDPESGRFWYNKTPAIQKSNKNVLPEEVVTRIAKEVLKVYSECLPEFELARNPARANTLSSAVSVLESIGTGHGNPEAKCMITKTILPTFPLSKLQIGADSNSKGSVEESNVSMSRLLVHFLRKGPSKKDEELIAEAVYVYVFRLLKEKGLKTENSSFLIKEIISILSVEKQKELWTLWVESWNVLCEDFANMKRNATKKNSRENYSRDRPLCHQSHYEFLWDVTMEGVLSDGVDIWPVVENFPRLLFDLIRLKALKKEQLKLLNLFMSISKQYANTDDRFKELGVEICSLFAADESFELLDNASIMVMQGLAACLFYSGACSSTSYLKLVFKVCKNAEIVTDGGASVFVQTLEWAFSEYRVSEESSKEILGCVIACLVHFAQAPGEHRRHRNQLLLLEKSFGRIAKSLRFSEKAIASLVCQLR